MLVQNITVIGHFYHFMDQLLMVQWSTSSTLTLNSIGNTLFLGLIILQHKVKTIEVQYHDDEEAELQ